MRLPPTVAELPLSNPPRVVVDATAVPADRGGVGRYVDELLPALCAEGADLAVVCQANDEAHYRRLLPGVELRTAPAAVSRRPVRLAWEQAGLPVLARRLRADVLHCPHYTMPLAAGLPVVTTLHDATFFTHPDLHLPVKRRFFQAWTRLSLARAARCVTPSAATRDELVRVAGARRHRIDVAHLGVDGGRFHVPTAAERTAARQHLGVDGPYVAFLGTLEPRKNVPALVRGWSALPDPPALVLAGGRGWDEEVDRAATEVPAGRQLLRPGYLPLELLAGFLGEAEVVAYPSLGEGFGLPVLEAMACGAPVLTTRLLSLPEVGGDAVAYTEPDADAIGAALGDLLADPVRREQLGAAGRLRAAQFDWRACARAHLAAYATAANS
jgi:glycosyltransferase involved in cell wall biosynthesis